MRELSLEEMRREFDEVPKLYKSFVKTSKTLIDEAAATLDDYQSGRKVPVKFTKGWLNSVLLGGFRAGDIVGIAGISGGGKSHFLQEMENDIFNPELNPHCNKIALLRNNYEMSVLKLYLRDLKKALNKRMTEILKDKFTEEEKRISDLIKNRESNPNIMYLEDPQTPEDWFSIICSYCEDNKDKELIIISIDHIALVKSSGPSKKSGIDPMVEYINQVRHIYKNVSFLVLSQLNRNIEERDNPKNAAPKRSDLYASDVLYHLCDTIIVTHNPFKLGLEEYMAVGKSTYRELNAFKKAPDKKTSSFNTKGLIFYHIIKMREPENGTIADLYIEKLYKPSFVNNYISEEEEELPKMEPNADLFYTEDSPFD